MSLRGFLKKHKKRIIKIALITCIILAIILLALYFLGIKVQFIINDELQIAISPIHASFNLTHSETENVNFIIENNNFRFCKTYCDLVYYDLSSDQIVSQENFTLDSNDRIEKTFSISGDIIGEGQAYYQIEAACHNIRSSLCVTDEPIRYQSSIVILNYGYTSEEITKRAEVKYELEQLGNNISVIQNKLKNAKHIASQVLSLSNNSRESGFIYQSILNATEKLNAINTSYSTALLLWKNYSARLIENYELETAVKAMTVLQDDIDFSIDFVYYVASIYNQTLSQLESLRSFDPLLISAYKYYTKKGSIWKDKIKTEYDHINEYVAETNSGNYPSFAQLYEKVNENLNQVDIINDKYTFDVSATLHYGQYHITRTILIFNEKRRQLNLEPSELKDLDSLNIGYPNITLTQLCDDYENAFGLISQANNDSIDYYYENVQPLINNGSINQTIFKQELELFKNYIITKTDNSIIDYTVKENLTDVYNLLVSKTQDNTNPISPTYSDVFPDLYFSSISTDIPVQLREFRKKYCTPSKNVTWPYVGLRVNPITLDEIHADIHSPVQILEPMPKCCYFNNCEPCCNSAQCHDDASKHPIILIHGHALRSSTSPQGVLNTFTMLQRKLQTLHIINAGQVDMEVPDTIYQTLEWGKANTSISFRGSYYYVRYYDIGSYSIATRKTDSIENYAIRLKEIVDAVLDMTGSDKVIIIAHSMGGLVSREYISLFGEDKVSKLIMIGTPNNGIKTNIYQLCLAGGSKKECSDMLAESVFLKRLNTPQNLDYKIPTYNIIASGCKMGEDDGDGIVTVKSAELNKSINLYVNGSCTDFFKTNLHSDVVNYPETFNYISQILNSEI